eukprot:COSAG01_NODE_1379_length_10522_cov_25.951454_3_plen_169_part_00
MYACVRACVRAGQVRVSGGGWSGEACVVITDLATELKVRHEGSIFTVPKQICSHLEPTGAEGETDGGETAGASSPSHLLSDARAEGCDSKSDAALEAARERLVREKQLREAADKEKMELLRRVRSLEDKLSGGCHLPHVIAVIASACIWTQFCRALVLLFGEALTLTP